MLEKGSADRCVVTTCGYCGVGCSFKAEVKGDEVVRMVPNKDGHAESRPLLRQGTLRVGLRDASGSRARADDSRDRSSDRGARCRGTKRSITRRRSFRRHPGEVRRAARSAGSRRRDAPTRKLIWCRNWCARRSATTTSIPARAFVIRRPATDSRPRFGTSAAPRTSTRCCKADVIMVIGANPTEGHPVFASLMKRRLRQGAKLIVADPRTIDLVRTAACRGRVSSAAPARHQRRADQCVRARGRDRRARRRRFRARALRVARVRSVEEIRRRRAQLARGGRENHRRAGGKDSRRRAPVRDRRQRASSTTASASPSTARAARWCSGWRTWRWRPAISGARASASIRCADRTTCRARATWDRSRTS